MSSIPQTKLAAVSRTSTHCGAPYIVRSLVKAYGELPENAKINETETFGEDEGECTFEFGDDEEVDIDEI